MIRVESQGAVRVATPLAVLNAEVGAELKAQTLDNLGVGQPAVVVDLHAAPFIDSAGLETLLDLLDDLQRSGGTLKLAAVNPLCRDILKATGVGDRFRQYPTVKLAIGSFLA